MSETAPVIIERKQLRNRTWVFRNRAHAGAVLAEMLAPLLESRPHAIVLAIPRGGAAPIAERLALPLDLAVVSKITPPWSTEMDYGAVAFGGSVHLNDRLVRQLDLSDEQVDAGVARTREKVVRRNAELREGRSYAAVSGADAVLLVDDGLASGFTLRAAIAAVRAAGAVPTAHESAARAIAGSVEAFYCPNLRAGYRYAVANAYEEWSDVDEETAHAILATFRPAARS